MDCGAPVSSSSMRKLGDLSENRTARRREVHFHRAHDNTRQFGQSSPALMEARSSPPTTTAELAAQQFWREKSAT